jgi:sodium transport system permease protein
MAVLLTRDPLRTLKLRSFHPKWIVVAIVLPLVLQPLAVELLHQLDWFFPELPPGAARTLEAMSSRNLPLWLPLLAFAVMPAICEELAFRGFILSGLQRSQRYRLAAVMSSIAFGVVHMIPQQVFNATLLGLVLAALALRSGSLVPCVIFHFVFNGVQVLLSRITPEQARAWGLERLLTTEGTVPISYPWPVLLTCAILAAPLLYWLVRGPVVQGWREQPRLSEPLAVEAPVAR